MDPPENTWVPQQPYYPIWDNSYASSSSIIKQETLCCTSSNSDLMSSENVNTVADRELGFSGSMLNISELSTPTFSSLTCTGDESLEAIYHHHRRLSNNDASEDIFQQIPMEIFDSAASGGSAGGSYGYGHGSFADDDDDGLQILTSEPTNKGLRDNISVSIPGICNGIVTLDDRIKQALHKYLSCSQGDFLVQVWIPNRVGNTTFLTTECQPFMLRASVGSLSYYRQLSTGYSFSADEDRNVFIGLPGRVFIKKTPEWTPNVQYYDRSEYLRVNDAKRCDIRGSLAVPVLEKGTGVCVAVIEVNMLCEKTEYQAEIENMCEALKEVNLYSTTRQGYVPLQITTKDMHVVFNEISEVLNTVCKHHNLPLAQTWIPCLLNAHDGQMPSSSTSMSGVGVGSFGLCNGDGPFCVLDSSANSFREACLLHCLEKGQGVPGKAFASNKPFFSNDVKTYSKAEYPLCHHARVFQLNAAVGIPVTSLKTGDYTYILEFFLPWACVDPVQQKSIVNSIYITMLGVCRSLHIGTEKEYHSCFLEEIKPTNPMHSQFQKLPENSISGILSSETIPGHNSGCQKPSDQMFTATRSSVTHNVLLDELRMHKTEHLKTSSHQIPINLKFGATGDLHDNVMDCPPYRKNERKRGSTEKTVSLSTLQKYFTGSLKDAARHIGVCPTTLKRICRQHGISRWPSRKINKVNRSLKKLQGVLDSVQGADSHFKVNTYVSDIHLGSGGLATNIVEVDNCLLVQDLGTDSTVMHLVTMAEKGQTSDGNFLLPNRECKISEEKTHEDTRNSCSGFVSLVENINKSATDYNPPRDSSHLMHPVVTNAESCLAGFDHTTKSMNPAHPEALRGSDLTNRLLHDEGQSHGSLENVIQQKCKSNDTNEYESRVHGGLDTFTAWDKLCTSDDICFDQSGFTPEQPVAEIQFRTSSSDGEASSKGSQYSFPSLMNSPNHFDSSNFYGSDSSSLSLPGNIVPNHQAEIQPVEDYKVVTYKVKFQDDTARFKLRIGSSLLDLRNEVGKRFKMNIETFDLKFLDDEDEWIMLTCDADLLECIDILNSSGGSHVKLLVRESSSNSNTCSVVNDCD